MYFIEITSILAHMHTHTIIVDCFVSAECKDTPTHANLELSLSRVQTSVEFRGYGMHTKASQMPTTSCLPSFFPKLSGKK